MDPVLFSEFPAEFRNETFKIRTRHIDVNVIVPWYKIMVPVSSERGAASQDIRDPAAVTDGRYIVQDGKKHCLESFELLLVKYDTVAGADMFESINR
jgi:hypothetical protein